MYRNFLRLLMLCIAWLSPPPLVAQTDSLDMFTVIDIAREQSLPALQAKNTYLKAYWSFKVFQASLKPGLTLGTTPVSYYRTVTQRYDSELNQDVFKLQQTLYHQATLSLSQQVSATGGQFFLESDVGRLQSFGDQGSANWSVTPVRIGYSQALLGFNGLKWDKKLRPAEYDLAKRQYTEALEYAALDALTYFFDLMLAEAGLALAEGNLMLRDSMLINGKRRHALGTLPLDDLLQLESSTLEASMSLAEAQMNQQQQQRKLAIFLRMDSLQAPLKAPNRLPSAPLSVERALTAYQAFHPQSLSFILQQLEAVRAEEQARKEQHFQANLQASIGLNQSNPNLNTALGNLLDQEQVLIGVSIPLLDWGQRKGMVKIATSERALVAVSIEQAQSQQQLLVEQTVLDCRLLRQKILVNQQTRALSKQRFDITRQRFLRGQVDLLKFNLAVQAENQARIASLQLLKSYWQTYYRLRSLTLFDFETGKGLGILPTE